jgi:hypothetical protein
MRKRPFLYLLIAALVIVAAAVAMRAHGGGFLRSWLPAIHGH